MKTISRYLDSNPKNVKGDFSGSPVVATLPFNARCAGSIPGQETKTQRALQPKANKETNKNPA